jgi:hypothetical protein
VTLGRVVAYFKYQSTKAINTVWETAGKGVRVWQRNYDDRIIRNAYSLQRVRRYINDNPRHWATDRENPLL